MESISTELFTILKFLLPGFVSAWVFHALTAYPKQSQFERLIQALIFTFFIQVVVLVVKWIFVALGHIYSFGYWDDNSQLIFSGVISLLLGIFLVYLTNNGKLHSLLANYNITKQSSFFSEWEEAFNTTTWFIILNFKDGRRLYGWPSVFPSDPTKGHFVIKQPEWISDGEYQSLDNAECIVINVNDIDSVEFMKEQPVIPDEET
ncbi:DUF6338 family protein [Kosakonia sacchari]|uniref:DUF6338 family protein n=1 Tax=Kosakonia sacchari TaxID=1158459 RepID=UPI002ACEBE0E|nr:DUF6338 family protein [Kosakonia sacchari]MDZ7321862.1 DUF6338 family protein [Kosakonia sacchari]